MTSDKIAASATDGAPPPGSIGGFLTRTASEAHAVELQARRHEGIQARIATKIADLTGSIAFVVLNTIWFVVWIVINLPGSPIEFDPFPFSLLTMIVSLEAIILSIFVLISENSQSQRAERLARLEMEINIIAEREITKLMGLVSDIHEHLGLATEPDVEEMRMETRLDDLAQIVDAEDASNR